MRDKILFNSKICTPMTYSGRFQKLLEQEKAAFFYFSILGVTFAYSFIFLSLVSHPERKKKLQTATMSKHCPEKHYVDTKLSHPFQGGEPSMGRLATPQSHSIFRVHSRGPSR